MIRSLYISPEQQVLHDVPSPSWAEVIRQPDGLLWVDFQATAPEEDEALLRDVFHFHPLAIDDALQEIHLPKLDDWDDYLYIVLQSVVFNRENGELVDTLELDIFLGGNFMVTHHDREIAPLDRLWEIAGLDERIPRRGADYLLYRLVDEVIASYMPVVESLDLEIDHIEDQLFNSPTQQALQQLFTLKRSVLHLRRMVGPQREVLNRLARDEYRVIDAQSRVYFRDIYDHLVRLYDISETLRDLVSGALDTYLSVVNNRMNDIVKTLTIITTIFMPLTFITGFFGMNFFQPEPGSLPWTGMLFFLVAMLLMAALPAVMIVWLRRRGWM